MLSFEHDLVQRSKRSDKGQHWTHPRFWCGEYLCKITKGYWQLLQSYRVHKAAWAWASLKVWKGHTKFNIKLVRNFYVKNIHVNLQHDTVNLWKVIVFTRSSQMLPAWTWCSSKGQTKVNIKLVRDFDVENIFVKLWNDTGNSCRVIVFTRQLGLELIRKFKKVTQRSTSNSSVILMWRILLSSYNLIQAIYEELSRSQGPPRCCILESLKKGHTKVKIKLGWNSDE